MNNSSIKSSVRIDEKISSDYDKMAKETVKSKTELLNTALLFYRDVYYCKTEPLPAKAGRFDLRLKPPKVRGTPLLFGLQIAVS